MTSASALLFRFRPLHDGLDRLALLDLHQPHLLKLAHHLVQLVEKIFLVDSYPDHGFVIDRTEASRLFYKVRAPNKEERALVLALGGDFRYPSPKPQETQARYLNEETKRKANETTTHRQRGRASDKRAPRGANARRDSGRPVEERRVAATGTGTEGIRIVPKGR